MKNSCRGMMLLCLFATLAGCESDGVAALQTPVAPTIDPLGTAQWNLKKNWSEGVDIGLAALEAGVAGEGVVVAVVDDGLDYQHEDLSANFSAALSYNYINQSGLPNAGVHGTHNAGIIGAEANNGYGITGIAPASTLVSYNLLVNPDSVNEADAMVRNLNAIDVSNNSWGPPDGTGELWTPGSLWEPAVLDGVTLGRNGKGLVYVWGGGNGQPADNSNHDGYANSPYVLSVGSVTESGHLTPFSEPGANLWLVAPSQGDLSGYDIITTDVTGDSGLNSGANDRDLKDLNYTRLYTGTSASTAQVSAVVSLMLSVNPQLGWRDVRMILARTAVKNDELDGDWGRNASAYQYAINHQYGFGVVNAAGAVALAKGWSGLPTPYTRSYANMQIMPIPDNLAQGVSSDIRVPSAESLFIEYVELEVDIPSHADFGDLQIELASPGGTVSKLTTPHRCYSSGGTPLNRCQTRLDGWRFGIARLLEEGSAGTWSLKVADLGVGDTAELLGWRLTIHGYQ